MTKKDYELIAGAIQLARTYYGTSDGARMLDCGVCDAARRIADALAADNPRFNRERFLRACVPGANVRARA